MKGISYALQFIYNTEYGSTQEWKSLEAGLDCHFEFNLQLPSRVAVGDALDVTELGRGCVPFFFGGYITLVGQL